MLPVYHETGSDVLPYIYTLVLLIVVAPPMQAGGVSSNGSIIAEDVKLVDVPELGYFTSDSPSRGEVWVKNVAMVSGYYKNEKEASDK